MRQVVKCINCAIKWLRVIPFGETEALWDIQLNCPQCGSNWFEAWYSTEEEATDD